MIVIAKQKPRAWLVWVGAFAVVGAAVFVSFDEGPGAGALALLIGACPLAAYWYYRIRPWEEDPEVLAAALRAGAGAVARHGRVSSEDAKNLRAAEEAAKKRWEAEHPKKPKK